MEHELSRAPPRPRGESGMHASTKLKRKNSSARRGSPPTPASDGHRILRELARKISASTAERKRCAGDDEGRSSSIFVVAGLLEGTAKSNVRKASGRARGWHGSFCHIVSLEARLARRWGGWW